MIPQPPDFFGQLTLSTLIPVIRVVLILVDFMLCGGIVYALYQGWLFRPKLDIRLMPTKRVLTLRSAAFQERWRTIMQKFQGGSPEAIRLGIIDADALVDEALKQIGVTGDHLADRLSQFSPDEMTTLNDLWRAHRLRNDIVHTPGFAISPEDAQLAMRYFERFLVELGVLS